MKGTTSKLTEIIAGEFNWDKRRIDCFVKMLLAMTVVKTVNLAMIANQMLTKTKLSNRYRRLQRFFSGCRIDYDTVAKFIFKLFHFDKKTFYLSMDRTNWQWGKKHINILFLGIVYRGVAIPIYWVLFNQKKGNSSTKQRIAIIKRFVKVFGKESIAGILADREFIGEEWFKWLIAEKIPFYIRIRNDATTINKHGKSINVSWLFYHLKAGEKSNLADLKPLFGSSVYLSAGRASNGELMIIASNIKSDDGIDTYLLRWKIEVLFHCLKSRGFNFEDTHMTERRKIKKLIALLVIAFCWAHLVGEWRHENEKPIKLKKHGRREKSSFRYGLDLIHHAIAQAMSSTKQINRLILFLKPPDVGLPRAMNYRPLLSGREF